MRRRHPNILWIYSEMNFLSLLHCVAYVVSPGKISGHLRRLGWTYFRRSSLVRGNVLIYVGYVGEDGALLRKACQYESCGVIYDASNVSNEDSYWDISVDGAIGVDVEDAALCFGCF